jgi:peptide chain release factor
MSDQIKSERIWLQITAGRGPVECRLAVARLILVLHKEARAAGFAFEVLYAVADNEFGAVGSALLLIEGEGARVFAERNRGSVLWVCPSSLRPGHKRKNWFVGVEFFEPHDPCTTKLRMQDVVIHTTRASGPGGQHVNKTESAVVAAHLPTGLSAFAQEERSQAMNKKLALARLEKMLADQSNVEKAGAERARWVHHNGLERGSPVRTFVGPGFKERR